MTKIEPNHPTPPTLPPVYRHSSETVRSKDDAGGEIVPSRYIGKGPAPKRDFLR
jgi:hypothetical protein